MPKKGRFRSYTFGSETIEGLCQAVRMEKVRGSRDGGQGGPYLEKQEGDAGGWGGREETAMSRDGACRGGAG